MERITACQGKKKEVEINKKKKKEKKRSQQLTTARRQKENIRESVVSGFCCPHLLCSTWDKYKLQEEDDWHTASKLERIQLVTAVLLGPLQLLLQPLQKMQEASHSPAADSPSAICRAAHPFVFDSGGRWQ